ncbi:MAG: aldehyde dehydrogenase, partial [Alistipes sp.]|nr:aldehyde dehydrogenase [Alistipes sp.]
DEANAYFRTHFEGTRHLLRGSRHSVAVLDGEESAEELQGLVEDITSYSGLGCRSVSMLFLPEGYELRLPKSEAQNPKLQNNVAQRRALYTLQHRAYSDYGAFIAVEGAAFPNSLAEVMVCCYSDLEEVRDWIREHREELQCVVSHLDIEGCVPFGRAQYPQLSDYADGVDTMQFLA